MSGPSIDGSGALAGPLSSTRITPLAAHRFVAVDAKKPDGVQVAVLWGDPEKGPHHKLLKLPAGYKSALHAHAHDYTAVVLQGTAAHGDSEADAKPQTVGTTWTRSAGQNHINACPGKEDCILFVAFTGPVDFIPAKPKAASK